MTVQTAIARTVSKKKNGGCHLWLLGGEVQARDPNTSNRVGRGRSKRMSKQPPSFHRGVPEGESRPEIDLTQETRNRDQDLRRRAADASAVRNPGAYSSRPHTLRQITPQSASHATLRRGEGVVVGRVDRGWAMMRGLNRGRIFPRSPKRPEASASAGFNVTAFIGR